MPDKETGILFIGELVRKILAGEKTQTRRIARLPAGNFTGSYSFRSVPRAWGLAPSSNPNGATTLMCPFGAPGDRLWVRETWHPSGSGPVLFAADYESKEHAGVRRWYPGIHLRRVDARIGLELTRVRLERLHDITENDAKAEGVTPFPADPEGDCWTDGKYRTAFEYKWGEINGWAGQPKARAPWASNPWVWALDFRRFV